MKTRHMGPVRKQEVFRLPGIHISNRISNPHPADSRRAPAAPEQHQWKSPQQSLPPPPRHNGFLVTEGQGPGDGVTYYQDRPPPPAHHGPARRQQSLPIHMADAEESRRQPNSAPGNRKNRSQAPKGPMPKLNALVAKSRGPGGETNHIVTTNFAGMSTRDHESSPTRYTRFASTWAQVRAENHIEMCATSSENTARKTGHEEEKLGPGATRPDGGGQPKSRSPFYQEALAPQKDDISSPRGKTDPAPHSPSQDKGNARPPGRKVAAGPTAAKSTKTSSVFLHPAKKRSREGREKQTIRFKTQQDEEEEEEKNLDGQGEQATSPTTEPRTSDTQHPRSSNNNKKRPQWDNRLALSVPAQQPPPSETTTPAKSWRRYEAELTHVPAVTSSQQVYRAYTGHTRQQVRSREFGHGDDDDDDYAHEEGSPELRPSTRGSQPPEEVDGQLRKPRVGSPPKEHILTRNEAKMFLHLQDVYGSEAFRQHRKDLFFKKLTDVQLLELQQQAAERRRKQQQREESKKRQKRQLMHVRRKFHREQLHRFRTQYVTSRVLEYEKGDRDLYGLPDDWESDEGVPGFQDIEDLEQDDSKAEDGRTRDTSKPVSNKKSPETVSERGVKGSQANSTQPGEGSQKPVGTNTSKSNVSETVPSSSANNNSQSGPKSRDKTNSTGSKTAASKDSVQRNGASVPQSQTDKSAVPPTASKNSKQNPNNDQTGKSTASQPTKSAMTTSNDNKNSSTNKQADTAMNGQKAPSNASKNAKQDSGQTKTAEDTVTTKGPINDSAVSSTTQSSGAKTDSKSVGKDTSKATDALLGVDKNQSKNDSSSPPKDPSASTKTTSARDQSKANGPQPTASSSKATGPNKQNTQSRSADRNSVGTGKKGADNSSPQKDKDVSVQKNKNDDSKPVNTDNNNNNDRAKKDNKDSSKRKEGSEKQTTTSQNNKTIPTTTTKNSGTKAPSGPTTSNTAPSSNHTVNGHASDTSHKPATSNNPGASTTSPATKDNKSSAAARHADSRGRKRKPVQSQPKSEAEQKKQLERKFGKMFEVNTGPSWNPGAKPPKMEGIDTVMIRVTDEKGRTRLKKREVKDVVKEAKAQLAVPEKANRRQSAGKGGYPVQESPNDIRPASADTLDFDDDDDEDEEDVFERVRRKYNLQIDSDDDDSTA